MGKGFEQLLKTHGETKAIRDMFVAYRALIDTHGWKEMMYAPKDGTPFEVITAGSTGIFEARWLGEDNDLLFIASDGDLWPAVGILFRLIPPK